MSNPHSFAVKRGFITLATAVLTSSLAFADSTTRAADHDNPACRAGQKYTVAARSGDTVAYAAIWADKVDYIGPDGKALGTNKEVVEVYQKYVHPEVVRKLPPQFISNLLPINDTECMVEFAQIDPATKATVFLAVDHFKVDAAGKVIFFRPYAQTAQVLANPVFRTALAASICPK
jgi:hypothetical protein